MALSRRTGTRFQASIWPGFVDAMTGLLLVLMFVLTIFMVVQFVLTERITGQETELNQLAGEVAALAQALGIEERNNERLEDRVGELGTTLSQAEAQVAALTLTRNAQATAMNIAQSRITSFEAQVAGLIAQRDEAFGAITALEEVNSALETEQQELVSERDTLNLALAASRSEIDLQAEAARLAAARREALDALVANLEAENAARGDEIQSLSRALDESQTALGEEEVARLAEAAAAELLRARLQAADVELTSMTLALERQRQEAEDILTLLAAARAAESDLDNALAAALLKIGVLEDGVQKGVTAQENLAALEIEQDIMAERLTEILAELDEAQSTAALQAAARAAAEAQAQAVSDDAADRSAALREQLASALAAQRAAEILAQNTTTQAQRRAALLDQAKDALIDQEQISTQAQRQAELLNQQVAALRSQLGSLQALLDDAKERDDAQQVQLQSLGSELNTALARVATEERRRAQLEEAERTRLEAEAAVLEAEAERLSAETKNLEQFRSEFFGRLRDLLGNQAGVRIEGDRFVFSSEVLFETARADLSLEGQQEVGKVAEIISGVAGEIPPEIDWIIRVDGHTDDLPLSGAGRFADNWELSQARALSVVRYMSEQLGIPPDRLAANGFGQYQPVANESTPEARAQNRRIELKFTEK
ncbi:MAG: peptidoglycan -binding protein [Roseobacter sp.]